MSVYELKYNELQHKVYTYNGRAIAVYCTTTDGCKADLDFRCRDGEIFKIGYSCRAVGNWSVSDNEMTGDGYTWSDMPINAYQTHLEGSGVPRPYFYDNCELDTNYNYKVCYFIGKDSNDRPCIDYLAYDEQTQTFVNAGFNGWSKYDGVLGFRMGTGFLMGLSTTSIYGQSVASDTNYGIEVELITNVPVFDSEEHARAWLENDDTTGLLNTDAVNPEEEYDNATKYWFIKNRIGHNTRVGSDYTEFRNYRFYPLSKKRICWYPVTPTASHPYNVKLKGYTGYEVRKANTPFADDDDDFLPYSGSIETDFLRTSVQFASNNYYTCYQFLTNIPKFDTESDAQDYIDGLRDITTASNWQDIARIYDTVIRPPYGNEDTGNDNGVNGQSYVQGVRMYVLTSTELNTFFNDIFDPDAINDLLHGLQLFGTNQISCIQSLMYLPLDADEIATVNASDTPIKLGSYTCEHATGHYVQNNNKMIDCGGFNCVRVYGDFRDYEIQMVLQLPYIGFREIKISDLLDKYVSFKYSVDITSGACSCHVYANSIEIACFDGNMGSQRPIQSIDQQTYLSNILGAVTGVVAPIPESISGKAGAVIQGVSGDGAGAISQGVGSLTSVAVGKTALNAFGLEQTVKDVPTNTRGAFAGCLGYFAWQKIHIHTYISKSYKPANALQNIGAPSGVGQTVGLFSGFLSVSFFQIADGFTGTETELSEIYDILTQGIYL